jgi:hypothetical protein
MESTAQAKTDVVEGTCCDWLQIAECGPVRGTEPEFESRAPVSDHPFLCQRCATCGDQ